jgi:hypothetical protein
MERGAGQSRLHNDTNTLDNGTSRLGKPRLESTSNLTWPYSLQLWHCFPEESKSALVAFTGQSRLSERNSNTAGIQFHKSTKDALPRVAVVVASIALDGGQVTTTTKVSSGCLGRAVAGQMAELAARKTLRAS